MTEGRLHLGRGFIDVRVEMSPYDGFVADFLRATAPLKAVLISGYSAILLGRTRQTEDIDAFVEPMDRPRFDAWWSRLHSAGFWCINAGRDEAWNLLENRLAPRFAKEGTIEPNMEVKFPLSSLARGQMGRAWRLRLLGVEGWIGDLSVQVAFKVYMGVAGLEADEPLPASKDIEDALHIATVAADIIDWAEVGRAASILEVPHERVEEFRALAS